jgi:hypothetical protein
MSPENFRPEAGQPTLEEAEKKRKRLDLYKKTLLADDYDTAESLDLSSLEPAERQKARDEVFAQKIDNLRVSWSADLVAKHIRKLQEKLGVSDEVTVAVVRQYCISAHAQPIEITSKGNRGIETRFRVTSEIQKITRQELPALFGIEFSDAEMRGYREDGFLEYIDERNFDLLRSGEQVKEALGVFGLDEGIVNSQRMKELLVRRIAEELSVADRFSLSRKWGFSRAGLKRNQKGEELFTEGYLVLDRILDYRDRPFFPAEELRRPEIQAQTDAWFSHAIGELPAIEEEPVKKTYLERVFSVNAVVAASPERLAAPETQAALSSYLDQYFDGTSQSAVSRLGIALGQLEAAGFSQEELAARAQAAYVRNLGSRDLYKAEDLRERFSLPEEFLNSQPVIETVTRTVQALAAEKKYWDLTEYLKFAPLPAEVLQSEEITKFKQGLILEALAERAEGDAPPPDSRIVRKLVGQLDFSNCPEFFADEAMKQEIQAMIRANVGPFWQGLVEAPYNFLDAKREGDQLRPTYSSHQLNPALAGFFNATQMAETLKNSPLVDDILADEYRKATQACDQEQSMRVLSALNANRQKMSEFFGVQPAVLGGLAFETLLKQAENGPAEPKEGGNFQPIVCQAKEVKDMQEEYGLTDEQAKQLATKAFDYFMRLTSEVGVPKWLSRWNINDFEGTADLLAEKFGLSPEQTKEGALILYANMVRLGWDERALGVKEKYRLNVGASEIAGRVLAAHEERLLSALSQQDERRLLTLIQTDKVPREFARQPQIQELARSFLTAILSSGNLASGEGPDAARALIANFLPDTDAQAVLDLNPTVAASFAVIQEKFPALAARCLASVDLVLSLARHLEEQKLVAVLEEHPFLEQAVIGNQQHGLKLLFKFDSLDQLSRGNIETLYRCKAEVLAENPGLETSSPEFRLAMQAKLRDHRSNELIVRALDKAGLDGATWLSYAEEETFILGQESSVPFSEKIDAPVQRVGVSIGTYRAIVAAVLKEYRPDLIKAQVPAKNLESLKARLAELNAEKTRAEASGDATRAEKIGTGISHLERQIASVKTVPVWDKISSGLLALGSANDAIVKTAGEIAAHEASLRQASEGPADGRRKLVASSQTKIEKAKRKLKEQVDELQRRLDGFQADLPGLLNAALSTGWDESVLQEIDERAAEAIDHYRDDLATLSGLYTVKKDEKVGRPMRIGLWSRDPDQDLYLGNYTNCCIRIDSEHMGAESTIADYLTDLGVQIVAVYDEEKNLPVVAAWCWPGADDADRIAFVVDNVEANTEYSVAHQQQLEERLKQYVAKFSAAVRAPHVVQGQNNNDLRIADMDSAYFKIGGYNRASGYFLEGEDAHVGGEAEEDDFDDEADDQADDENHAVAEA